MEEPNIITELVAFLETLPDGFGCGPREQMAVRELLLHLIDEGGMPGDPARLKTLIAPLVCGDPQQQREFYDRFTEWCASRRVPGPKPGPGTKPSRFPWAAVAAAVLFAGLLSGGVYYLNLFRSIPVPPRLEPPRVSVDAGPDTREPERRDRIRGIVQTPDGLPLENATVRIPFGIDSPEYPNVVTDVRGSFTFQLGADRSNALGETGVVRPATIWSVKELTGFPVFSPDGARIATNVYEVKVWDAATGRMVFSLPRHTGTPYSVAFSPDSRRFATAGEDGTKIWDAANGREILALQSGYTSAVAFSPGGRLATAQVSRGFAIIWDAATGQQIVTLMGRANSLSAVAFSPDGRRLATASDDGTVGVWDAATGRAILSLEGHADSVNSVSFSPSGDTLASASRDRTARIWNAATGVEMMTLRGHASAVGSVAFSRDARRLMTTSDDGTARIWDAVTGKQILSLPPGKGQSNGIAFSPDGRLLATTSFDALSLLDLSPLQPDLAAASLNLLVTHPDYDPTYIENASRTVNARLGPQKAAQRVLVFASPPPSRRYSRWVSVALALILAGAGLLAYWRQRNRDNQRKAFLDQWETHLDLEPVRVHTRSQEDDLFQGAEVATLARELRRRRPEPTSQLAVEPTVRNTAARAGMFTPVRRQRKGGREYLVLLESKSARDQQARFWSCLFDRLSARDVWLDRYSFSGDPRVCEVPESDRGWARLEEIAALHPRHELWVFAAAARFFDATTRLPAPWVLTLSRWPNRAVLTLADGTEEDRQQLADLGFAVAPAGVADLAGLQTNATHAPSDEAPASYPLVLEADESRWLQGPAPTGESGQRELRALDRQLRAWLGRDGYRCLLACAVYPGLAWNLTLHFARELIPASERESTLARLVRLPWFRHGRMPRWLRAFLKEKLNGDDSATVRNLLQDFFKRKGNSDTSSSPSLEFVKREIAADLRAQNKPPTRDYVFLSFLMGRKARIQDVEASTWLQRLLYPDGLPILGLRRGLWLVAGLIVGVLFYFASESFARVENPAVWQERNAPATVAAQPVNNLSARALEIAAARLGQPAGFDFASLSFDQAVPFTVPRGMAKPGTARRPGMIFTPDTGTLPSLVEQVTERGLIMLESFEGRVRRVFRQTSELAGSFSEITEGSRSGVIPLDLSPADWAQDLGDPSGGPGCTPPNPVERSFGAVATPAGTGISLTSVSNTAMCCKCIRRGKSIRIPPVKNRNTLLQGWFSAARGASDPYSLGSIRVDLLSNNARVGTATFAAEHRPNNNCVGEPGKEIILESGAPFSIPLQSLSTTDWQQVDEIVIYLQGYACVSGTNTVTLSNLRLVDVASTAR